MALPNNADRVVVRGFWWDETTQAGVGGTITFDPVPLTGTSTPNVRDATSYGHIKTRQRVARPDATTGYYAAMLLSSNDPDLDAYGGRKVTFSGETPFVIEVPYNAPTITVDAPLAAALPELHVGDNVKAVWLVDAALITTPPPTPLTSYLSSEQTLGAIADGVEAHDGSNEAHPDLRAAIASATIADATTSVKGKAKLLGGTADAPTVPYSAVTGAPTSLPPSGGAGGVLGGSFPNPSFAVDMATQAELDAVASSIPEAARDALGAALVAGSNVTITPNDGADTITIGVTLPSAYTDEQAQDAFAALIAAGTHSGISFAYNDAGNALSATVAAQTWSQITGKPTFAAVATSGSASDITTGTLPDGVIPAGIARDTEVATAVANLVNSAPATLDTLGEIATALQADESAAAALATTVAGKAPLNRPIRSVSANTTAVAGELLKVDASGGVRTVTPPASPATGAKVVLVKTDASTNAVTWAGAVDGDSGGAQLTGQWVAVSFVWDGSAWLVESTTVSPTSVNGRASTFNVKDYGAVGDGATDDSAAIQAAFDAVPTAGGVVWFPTGNYRVVTGITCAKPVTVQGVGHGAETSGGSRVQFSATTGTCLSFSTSGVQLIDLTVERPNFVSSHATAGVGVYFGHADYSGMTRVSVRGFWNNVEMRDGYYHWLTDCRISDFANYGVHLANAINTDSGDQSITGCVIGKNLDTVAGGTAVHWVSGGGLRFQNNKINAPNAYPLSRGLHIDSGSGTQTSVFPIIGNSIENCSDRCVYFTDAGAGSFVNKVIIVGNEIASFHSATLIEFANTSQINGVNIGNNNLSDAPVGIILKRIAQCTVTGNSSFSLTGTGIHLTTGVKQTTIANNRWNHEVTYPFYADNTDQTNDVAYEASFLYNGTTGAVDVLTCGMVNYATAFLDIDITGVVQGVAAVANRFSRVVASAGTGQDSSLTTVGTDVSVGSGYTAAVQVTGRSGAVGLNINETSGSGIQALIRVKVSGAGLQYVKQLVNG